jgi:hypothetical protein
MSAPQPEGVISSAGAGVPRNNNNINRCNQHGRRVNQGRNASATPPSVAFVGSEPLLRGYIYDVPNGKNVDQFNKTTKEVKIMMGTEMGDYAVELSNAFDTFTMVMPTAVVVPTAGADEVVMTIWKSDKREFDAKTKAFNSFKAKLFLKLEGQCTEAMKSRLNATPE